MPLLQERHDAADVRRGVARAALQRLLPVEPGDPAGASLGDAFDGPSGAVVVPVLAADVPVLDADHLLELRGKAALGDVEGDGDPDVLSSTNRRGPPIAAHWRVGTR